MRKGTQGEPLLAVIRYAVRTRYLPLRDAQPALRDARKTVVVEEPIVASGTEEVAREQHHLFPRVCEWVDSVGSACCRAHTRAHARTHTLYATHSGGPRRAEAARSVPSRGSSASVSPACARGCVHMRARVSARAFGIVCVRGCVRSGFCMHSGTPWDRNASASTALRSVVGNTAHRIGTTSAMPTPCVRRPKQHMRKHTRACTR